MRAQPTDLFYTGVQLPVEEYAGIQILLRAVAEILVLSHNVLEEVADLGEFSVRGVIVSIHLVLHVRLGRGHWYAALNEEEVRSAAGDYR